MFPFIFIRCWVASTPTPANISAQRILIIRLCVPPCRMCHGRGWPYGPWEEGPPLCGGHPPTLFLCLAIDGGGHMGHRRRGCHYAVVILPPPCTSEFFLLCTVTWGGHMGHGRRGRHYVAVILPPPCTSEFFLLCTMTWGGHMGHGGGAAVMRWSSSHPPAPVSSSLHFDMGWPYGPWEEGPPLCGGHPPTLFLSLFRQLFEPLMGVAIWAMGGGAAIMRRSSSRLPAHCCHTSNGGGHMGHGRRGHRHAAVILLPPSTGDFLCCDMLLCILPASSALFHSSLPTSSVPCS